MVVMIYTEQARGKTASNFISTKTSQTVGGAPVDIEFLLKVIYDNNRGGFSAC